MLFKKVISKEGWELRLHEEHEIFKLPTMQVNFDEPIELSYTDLYMLAFNKNIYSFLTKEEIVRHLELLDKICYVNKQIELLDYGISKFHEDIEEWNSFINPSVIEIVPEYLLKFPQHIDINLESFSKLKNCNDLKRKKLLEYAQNNNLASFSLLFMDSLINNKFLRGIFTYGIKYGQIIIDKGFDDWNQGMRNAAMVGNKELVELFIEKGANKWNKGMKAAARGGHKDLVLFFISKGAKKWESAQFAAAQGGHKDLVLFFFRKGAKDWNWVLKAAARGGHKDLVEFCIDKDADNWNQAMKCAARGGHKDLVDLFISEGGNNFHECMYAAARGGHKELVIFFINYPATKWYLEIVYNDENWGKGMLYAARGGHKELVLFFIKKRANRWNSGMIRAARGGHKELVDFFIEKGADDWNLGMYAAARGGHTDLVNFLREMKALNKVEINLF